MAITAPVVDYPRWVSVVMTVAVVSMVASMVLGTWWLIRHSTYTPDPVGTTVESIGPGRTVWTVDRTTPAGIPVTYRCVYGSTGYGLPDTMCYRIDTP